MMKQNLSIESLIKEAKLFVNKCLAKGLKD